MGGSVGANTQRRIGDIPQLRGRVINGIQAFCSTEVGTAPSGGTMVVQADLKNIVLTLVTTDSNREFVREYPIYDLNPVLNGGLHRELANEVIQWEKSYITILGTSPGPAANEVLCLNVHYGEKVA